MNEPKLRFRDENGEEFEEWTESKLGELGSFSKGAPFTKADLSDEGFPVILYGELYTTYGEVTQNIKSCSSRLVDKKFMSQSGDVLFPLSGETPEEISKTTCVLVDGVVLGGDLLIFRPKSSDGRFISYLSNHGIKNSIGRISQGKSIVHTNASELSKIEVYIPSLPEQEKIAEFLGNVDAVIEKKQQEMEDLEKLKKGLLQKIFSQEVRFKDANGKDFQKWEVKRIGNILDIRHGRDYKGLETGNIPVLGTGGVITYVNKYLCNWPCVLIGRKGTIDKPQFMETPFWSVDTLFYTRPKENQHPLFQYYLFNTINWKKYNEASGVPSLSASTIEKISVTVPIYLEQQKIANFLRLVERMVGIANEQFDQLKLLKKGLLQQML